jgi:uncharacterized protein
MRKAALAGFLACLALPVLSVPGARPAAGLDCSHRRLGDAEATVCQDAQLARAGQQLDTRIKGMARRLSFGQYLGLRYWNSGWAEERDRCGANRPCLAATFKAQLRFLDRLQQCLESSSPRRACLRNTLNLERQAQKR